MLVIVCRISYIAVVQSITLWPSNIMAYHCKIQSILLLSILNICYCFLLVQDLNVTYGFSESLKLGMEVQAHSMNSTFIFKMDFSTKRRGKFQSDLNPTF